MWFVVDPETGREVYRDRDWHRAVKWAMRHGGELDIVWQQGWPGEEAA